MNVKKMSFIFTLVAATLVAGCAAKGKAIQGLEGRDVGPQVGGKSMGTVGGLNGVYVGRGDIKGLNGVRVRDLKPGVQ